MADLQLIYLEQLQWLKLLFINIQGEKTLKTLREKWEAVNKTQTDRQYNDKKDKGQTLIYKTFHRKPKIKQHKF